MDTITKKIEQQANRCSTLKDIYTSIKDLPRNSTAHDIYMKRLYKLLKTNNIKDESLSYKTATEAREIGCFLNNYISNTYCSSAMYVLVERVEELSLAEAPVKTAACTTTHQIARLHEECDKHPILFREPHKVKMMYEWRWIELTRSEVLPCKTMDEVQKLRAKIEFQPSFFGASKDADKFFLPLEVSSIYSDRRRELALKEAPAKAKACKNVAEAKELYKYHKERNCEAGKIYRKRWVFLSNKEASTKAKNCKNVAEAKELYENSPKDSKARSIYELRWMELNFPDNSRSAPDITDKDEKWLKAHLAN